MTKIIVNLNREDLQLGICPVCKALTRWEDGQEHLDYHHRNGELARHEEVR